jgi:hypothetical protein
MNLFTFLIFFGLAFQVLVALFSVQQKAVAAKVVFHPLDYFKDDWLRITIAVCANILYLILLPDYIKAHPDYQPLALKIGVFTTGYFGNSILFALLSAVKKRIDAAIAAKAGDAGIFNGTGDELTPAAKPPKTP